MQSLIEERHTRLAQQIDAVRDPLARNGKVDQLLSETMALGRRGSESEYLVYDA